MKGPACRQLTKRSRVSAACGRSDVRTTCQPVQALDDGDRICGNGIDLALRDVGEHTMHVHLFKHDLRAHGFQDSHAHAHICRYELSPGSRVALAAPETPGDIALSVTTRQAILDSLDPDIRWVSWDTHACFCTSCRILCNPLPPEPE